MTHLSWATWANRSRLLICHEWPQQFAHGLSFVLSDLSDSLTAAHLSWAIWANRSQSLILFEQNERMSEERIPSPAKIANIKLNCLALCHGKTIQDIFCSNVSMSKFFKTLLHSTPTVIEKSLFILILKMSQKYP